MTSSCGYITEFNRETTLGYIQIQNDENHKSRLQFRLCNLKKNSRKYFINDDSTFAGELFDFDIIQHIDGTEDEAINIRHRVLRCPILTCSRLKAFTHKKALEEHVESKHLRIKEVKKVSSEEVITSKLQEQKDKKVNKPRKPQPFLVDLVTRSTSVLGHFIGKSGVNLKLFQRENKVLLKILTKSSISQGLLSNSNVQVQVKPYNHKVDVNLVSEKLKLAWNKAICYQKEQDEQFKRLLRRRQLYKEQNQSSSAAECIDIECDSRLAAAFSMPSNNRASGRGKSRRRTKTISRRKKERTGLSLKKHRHARTRDRQQRGRRVAIIYQKKQTSMKRKQWIVKEQLNDMK